MLDKDLIIVGSSARGISMVLGTKCRKGFFQLNCFVCCKRLGNHFVSFRSLGFIYKAGRKPIS
jgi:hypothetical protein